MEYCSEAEEYGAARERLIHFQGTLIKEKNKALTAGDHYVAEKFDMEFRKTIDLKLSDGNTRKLLIDTYNQKLIEIIQEIKSTRVE